ncbi:MULTISPECIES: spermidine/putrescine ABC transporter ATP-binding protein PotA [Marinobacter]|jgi:spermidine/putrescine transport system ATP-binding protein|uniref:Spermidine/putrescine import ATP-binding protein PotA n=1 Tax=Marinobacter salarius TaxID=1420917 RepID=W5YRI5_9GAMM|nr:MULTISPECIES: spermidine/putrescine ABC transporter ATP-binding protein PotA [Marinobacter]AHI31474.1 putrescine/spermidine ABC transporter ATPase [Marinobacter salarius]ARM85958.1 spermidine/putrescine import ATP-binding protein PotA [Marinobacter salarius]MAB51659.1 spermidine/putrescine ABC transporter ATP-binding protein PotA [Marinobacter sp.]MBJ7298984.1 spermidine/putrescine ABC transporter ATP-binding protein PotA [Marinobacter salarius]MBS8231979.1 spermidine/putrescine ABC transpo|tara:strand:- start:451 stop:1581 length:1131 start_codon:yes stop_codon:yes gene_type:complete
MKETLLSLKNVSKAFDDKTVLNSLDLDILDGEFITLLGPSGCGKTTLLRLMAGFEQPDTGAVSLSGHDITHAAPEHRPLNTVFQNYALFPHMSVYDNVAYGLKMEKRPRDEIRQRVDEVLAMVQLQDFARRKPHQLSGGQQQRVAIARAVVKRPQLLLLDEPLSALDYKLRRTMQVELKRLQRELGITFVFVTHDQEEALSMSDRVVVLKDGAIQQLGTPREIYERPANLFTARFVGETNLFPGYLTSVEDTGITLDILGLSRTLQKPGFTLRKGEQVNVLLRPEDIRVLAPEDEKGLAGRIVERNYKGSTLDSVIHLEDGTEVLASEFFDEDDPAFDYKLGEPVRVSWVDGWEWLLPVELEPVNNDAEEGLSTNA